MLNIIESFEEIMYSKDDKSSEFTALILSEEFTAMCSMATVTRDHDNFIISCNNCIVTVGLTSTGDSDVHHIGTLNSDVAIMSLTILALIGQFVKKPKYVDGILDEINEIAEWCGNTPFDVFCDWERVEESEGPVHKVLKYHRSCPLRFGTVKVPANFTIDKTEKQSNPEKLERRTRIW